MIQFKICIFFLLTVMEFSYYENFVEKGGDFSLKEIYVSIKEGLVNGKDIKPIIKSIRGSHDDSHKSNQKKRLPGFSSSGTFGLGRKAQFIKTYNSTIQIDIDKISQDELEHIKQCVPDIPGVLQSFKSPSGNGYKLIVLTDNESSATHVEAFRQVKECVEGKTGLEVDPSTKDLARLCFYSYDPDVYYNPSVEAFKVILDLEKPVALPAKKEAVVVARVNSGATIISTNSDPEKLKNPNLPEAIFDLFMIQVEFTNSRMEYTLGNRNNYIHYLACNCSGIGIPNSHTAELIHANFFYNKQEINNSIKSAYKRGKGYGSRKDIGKSLISKTQNNGQSSALGASSYYPSEIYDTLPTYLAELCKLVPDKRERDVFLTAFLGGLSYYFPDVYYDYGDERIYSNLYIMVTAPAATGKGKISLAKQVFEFIDMKAYDAYKKEYVVYKKSLRDCKASEDCDPDDLSLPMRKQILLPGNTSDAAVFRFMTNQNNRALIIETEANALTNASEQSYGAGLSVLLRQAYHHEAITKHRGDESLNATIYEPQLSVVLGGTPNQLKHLITELEGGLVSRFIFYPFDTEFVYKSRHKKNRFSMKDELQSFSVLLEKIVSYTQENSFRFEFTDVQIAKDKKAFDAWFKEVDKSGVPGSRASIKRLPLATTKLGMIFTALRRYNEQIVGDTGICSDVDFQNALKLSEVFKENSLSVLNFLNGTRGNAKMKKEDVLKLLPAQFETREAQVVASWFSIPEDSMRKYLPVAESKGKIKATKAGYWEKS